MRQGSPKHLSRSRGNENKWDGGEVLLEVDHETKLLDPQEVFGNCRPVELEIGVGKGTFLVERAAQRPEINFLGIEYARAYCVYSADRFRRRGLSNVRMVPDDAELIVNMLPDESMWRVHIYFPDPWPKKRHHRRRFIQRKNLAHLRRILKPGGQLLIVTDHMGYFQQIAAVLEGAEGFAKIKFPTNYGKEGEVVGTNFERKYVTQGRSFYSAALMKFE